MDGCGLSNKAHCEHLTEDNVDAVLATEGDIVTTYVSAVTRQSTSVIKVSGRTCSNTCKRKEALASK